MTTPPSRGEKNKSWVDNLHRKAHVDAARFYTHATAYDAAHELAFNADQEPICALINLKNLTPLERTHAQEWLRTYTVFEETRGDETLRKLTLSDPHTATLFFALRAEHGRPNPTANEPIKSLAPASSKKHKETAAKHLTHQDHLFDSLKKWVALGPTQNYCLRSLIHKDPIFPETPAHYFALSVPANNSEFLETFRNVLLNIEPRKEAAPPSTYAERASNTGKRTPHPEWDKSVLYDIAHDMQPDNNGRYFCESIGDAQRGEITWQRFTESLKKPECYTTAMGPKSQTMANITADNTFSLRLRLNPDHEFRKGNQTLKRKKPPSHNTETLEDVFIKQYGSPLVGWLREQGLENFAVGITRIPSPSQTIKHTPDSCLLRITIPNDDMKAKLLLGSIASYIHEFSVTPHKVFNKGGMAI